MPIICYDITTPAGEITTGEYECNIRDEACDAAKKFNQALHAGHRVRSWRKSSTYAESKPQVLELIGKRWFQQSYGNTYFTARAVLDGEVIATCPKEYGYGDQWKQQLLVAIGKSGKLPTKREREREYVREWAERIGVTLVENVTDVARERDL